MQLYTIKVNGGSAEFSCGLPDEDPFSALEEAVRDGSLLSLRTPDNTTVLLNGRTVVTIEIDGPMPTTKPMH
jgi:hypothetical protein